MFAPTPRPAHDLSSLITRHVSRVTCGHISGTCLVTWHAEIVEIAVANIPAASEWYLYIRSTFVIQQSITNPVCCCWCDCEWSYHHRHATQPGILWERWGLIDKSSQLAMRWLRNRWKISNIIIRVSFYLGMILFDQVFRVWWCPGSGEKRSNNCKLFTKFPRLIISNSVQLLL